jgi:ADP-ribose pyrophosphatase YjhB (NUDIX family)
MKVQQNLYQAVVALIRRDEEILLIEQQEPYDPIPTWMLPGGSVEPDELLYDALAREVREETGLTVLHPGHLAYIAQYDNPPKNHQLLVYVFEIQDWRGDIACADPDGYVMQASFWPLAEAMNKMDDDLLRFRCEPVLSYLRGECETGALWSYRHHADGQCELLRGPGEKGML